MVIVGSECSLRQMDIEAMQERNRKVIEGYSKLDLAIWYSLDIEMRWKAF
jgi:hypothetical protein